MVGVGIIILDTLGVECKVYPYSSEYETKILPLENSATSYYYSDRNTYILRLNKALGIIEE